MTFCIIKVYNDILILLDMVNNIRSSIELTSSDYFNSFDITFFIDHFYITDCNKHTFLVEINH